METPKIKNPQVGHVDNIFKWYERQGKDDSGNIPIIIKPNPEQHKKNKPINLY
jgi:hypothetical protein